VSRQVNRFKQLTIEDVLRNPTAKRAFDRLIQRKVCPETLWNLLELAVHNQSFPRSHDMFFVDGMTRKQVTNFPRRLREVARQIDGVRENFNLKPNPGIEDAGLSLASSLRRYADQLERALRFGRAFMAKNPRYWDLAAIFRLKLLNYVEQNTGTPQFSLIADLLHGAFIAAGMDIDVDADSLSKLHRRQTKVKSPL
jgi:hypothetical protein